MTEHEPQDPNQGAADELFAAAGRGLADPGAADPLPDGEPPADEVSDPEDAGEEIVADAAAETVDERPITSADSPYPDGPGPTESHDRHDPIPGSAVETTTEPVARYRPPTPGSFGYHTPPPSVPGGPPGHRAGPYPAGPPRQPQPQFGRRAPQHSTRPNADGYYPSDYYLGTDWTRVVLGGLVLLMVAIVVISGGFYLVDRFDPRDDDNAAEELPTVTPIALVPAYECAGDPQPVTEIPPPSPLLIAGRTADSTWLAFRNPNAPPLQLWVRLSQVPGYDATVVGIVSCASSPQEFPTPRGQSAPVTPSIPEPPTPSLSTGNG